MSQHSNLTKDQYSQEIVQDCAQQPTTRRLLADCLRNPERTIVTCPTAPGTSVVDGIPPGELGPPDLVYTVDYLAKPVGTKEAKVPRGYLIPADMAFIAEKLKTHNVKVEVLDKPIKVTGEQFVIDKLKESPRGGYDMVALEGGFAASSVKEFPAGTFHIDMAQPAANTAFYCLEPQAADGFVGWDVLTDYLRSIGVDQRSIVYPIYKYFKILE